MLAHARARARIHARTHLEEEIGELAGLSRFVHLARRQNSAALDAQDQLHELLTVEREAHCHVGVHAVSCAAAQHKQQLCALDALQRVD